MSSTVGVAAFCGGLVLDATAGSRPCHPRVFASFLDERQSCEQLPVHLHTESISVAMPVGEVVQYAAGSILSRVFPQGHCLAIRTAAQSARSRIVVSYDGETSQIYRNADRPSVCVCQ